MTLRRRILNFELRWRWSRKSLFSEVKAGSGIVRKYEL
jgi:hypothetical protein